MIQLTAISDQGRFSNRLIHYVVGKCYAESVGATVEIPKGWIGEELFQINERHIVRNARQIQTSQLDGDFKGTASLPPFFSLPHSIVDPCMTREIVKRFLQWKPEYLRVTENEEAALHIRGGDFRHLKDFPVITAQDMIAATKWKERFGRVPCVVSEDSPSNTGLFSKALSFLEDFQRLMRSNNVFVYPRSTFSQMAALLGDGNIYMPYDYKPGKTSCKFKLVDPARPVIFPTRNNSL